MGGTGQKELSIKILSKFKVQLPSLKEQTKIASFISKIDTKLDLLNEKYEYFIDFKKYLMQQIFTQKLRFKNQNDVWNIKKVKDYLFESKIDGKDNIHKRLTVKLNLKGVYPREIKTTEIEGATKQFVRKSGQFIYGKQNLYKGAFGIIPDELDNYLSSSDIPSFDFNKKMNSTWFYYYFSRKNFYENLEKLSTGTGSKRISPKEFLNIKIQVPSIEEQTKIADYLSSVDSKIDLIEKQITLMEEFKKGLLQQMFVYLNIFNHYTYLIIRLKEEKIKQ